MAQAAPWKFSILKAIRETECRRLTWKPNSAAAHARFYPKRGRRKSFLWFSIWKPFPPSPNSWASWP